MAVISQAKLCLNGSHAGVSIGEDGPSQMALEDLAEFRALGGSVVLYPSDPNQTVKLVEAMADHDGISYLRSTRAGLPTLYGPDEEFKIGGSRVVRESDDDQVTLIGAGVTLHEAVKAADQLAEDGINARVIDLYSVKPVDVDTLAGGLPGHRRPAHRRRGPLARGRDRRGGAERVRRHRRAPAGGQARRHRTCLARASRPSCWPTAGSTPTTSSRPRAGWWSSARRSAALPRPAHGSPVPDRIAAIAQAQR